MRKDVALAMKDHYLSYYHKYDNGRLEELDIKKHGYDFMGHIKFLFDRTDSTLSITGDYGNAIFRWASSLNTLKDIQDYTQDLSYFASKCLATSRPTYEYDGQKAEKDIKEWLTSKHIRPDEWGDMKSDLYLFDSPDDFIDQLVSCIDYQRGLDLELAIYENGGALKDALNYIDDDWQEDAEMWGKQISGEIQVWAHALELGFRWKKQQEAKNDTL